MHPPDTGRRDFGLSRCNVLGSFAGRILEWYLLQAYLSDNLFWRAVELTGDNARNLLNSVAELTSLAVLIKL